MIPAHTHALLTFVPKSRFPFVDDDGGGGGNDIAFRLEAVAFFKVVALAATNACHSVSERAGESVKAKEEAAAAAACALWERLGASPHLTQS